MPTLSPEESRQNTALPTHGGIDWSFLVSIIMCHYHTHGDVSCTNLLTSHLALSDLSHNPSKRAVLFAMFAAADYLAQYHLHGQITTIHDIMWHVLMEYSQWDWRERVRLTEARLDKIHHVISSIDMALYMPTIDVLNAPLIVSWTTDNSS